MTPSVVAAPALSITVDRRKSTKRKAVRRRSVSSMARTPAGAVDEQVGASRASSRRRLVGADADAERGRERALVAQRAQRGERVQVGEVVADVERRVDVRLAGEQAPDAAALVERDRRADLEHLAAPVRPEALRPPPARSISITACLGGRLVRRAAPVERRDDLLVLLADAQAPQLVGHRARGELLDPPRPGGDLGVVLDLGRAAAQDLAAVVAHVGDRPQRRRSAGRWRPGARRRRRPARSASRPRSAATRVGSGTCASSAWRTIGASVPSTSSRTAARLGSERSGSSASASGAATDTRPMIAGMPREPNAEARGDRSRGRRRLQRALRRRRRHRHGAALHPLAGLRGARGDRHLAGGDRDHRRGRGGGAARLRERPRAARACSSGSPRSAACSPGRGCSSACRAGSCRSCSRSCCSAAP